MQKWYPITLIVAALIGVSWYAHAAGPSAPNAPQRFQIDSVEKMQRVFDTETGKVYFVDAQWATVTLIDPPNRHKSTSGLIIK